MPSMSQYTKHERKVIRLTKGIGHKIIAWLTIQKLLLYAVLFIIQLVTLTSVFLLLYQFINPLLFLIIINGIGVIFSIYVVNTNLAAEYKIAWIMFIMVFSVIGIVAYLIFGRRKLSRRKVKKYNKLVELKEQCIQDSVLLKQAGKNDRFVTKVAKLIFDDIQLPISQVSDIEYFNDGMKYYQRLLNELNNAQKFIFLEFFIIKKGRMWDGIFEILKQKAQAGIEVRVTYDDLGSFRHLPDKFGKNCYENGIKLYCFNKLRPFLDISQNNRTHRKMVIIDGKCGFTGGINIGDEYINLIQPLGHWKDSGIMIKGSAVKSLTTLFLTTWQLHYGHENTDRFLTNHHQEKFKKDVYCIPFADIPAIGHTLCLDVYLLMIYQAKKYVYINTPYLIIDGRMKAALISAAKSGIDVRISVPHIPDKRSAFALTKSFYKSLVLAGVKIYEYRPGFLHAKSIVSDDQYAVIGTSNMDFRSFYLHYENNIFLNDHDTLLKMKEDYLETCNQSILISIDEVIKISIFKRIYRGLLRLLAPLM